MAVCRVRGGYCGPRVRAELCPRREPGAIRAGGGLRDLLRRSLHLDRTRVTACGASRSLAVRGAGGAAVHILRREIRLAGRARRGAPDRVACGTRAAAALSVDCGAADRKST